MAFVSNDPEIQNAPRRAYVVMGMHRSGTSAMTRTLSLLGASLPKGLMAPVKDNNESGFWEPQSVADLNDEILQALDSEWDDVFAFRPREYLSNFDQFYSGRAAEILQREYDGAESIVIKDPRFSVLAKFWERVLRQAGYSTNYVVMVRNPLEVADSLRDRDGFPHEKSLLLWGSYMLAAERDTREEKRIFVSYADLLKDWRSVRNRVEAGTGVPFPRDTPAAAVEIDRFLDRHLQHHQATSHELLSRSEVPEAVKVLYSIFEDACEDKPIDETAIEAVEAELSKIDLLLGPLFADLRGRLRGLNKDLTDLTDAHADVRERAAQLEDELAVERAEREAETGQSARSRAELETRLAEMAERVTDLDKVLAKSEAERVRLLDEAAEKTRTASELADRLSGKKVELEEARNLLIEKDGDLASLSELLSDARRDVDLTRQDLAKARDQALTNEGELAERFQELARLTSKLQDQKKLVGDLAERVALKESKLAQRFQEIAILTKRLKDQEKRANEADEHLEWLQSLNERLGKEPRWWALLPKSSRRQRALRRLSVAGVFDADGYLARYPDVAEAGRDPLDHFLLHGYEEGRTRD